ncbi:MAG: primosomal replication protein N [Burkholderiales bacterium]|nr:MAG: primosomal replication protein N [Burkholderiales bacterium]
MNRLGLTAALVEREAIRYTPAGVPIVGLKLSHQSVQREAGVDRTIELEISAIAADRLALRMDRVALGTELKLEGFLAPRRRNVKALVLHITDFELHAADRTA